MRAWVNVAELARTKTLSGGLVARSVPGLPFLLSEGLEVAFVPPRHEGPRRGIVESTKHEGKDAYLVTFEGVRDIDTAELLAGCYCLVRRADLPEDALVAVDDDLAGYEVHDACIGYVGIVEDVLENPGQTLLSVARAGGSGSALIPLVDAFVTGFDDDARRIDVALPDGLLDL